MTGSNLAFWCTVVFVAYVYFGYPLLVALLARIRPASPLKPGPVDWQPRVAVIVPVYNGSSFIEGKLESLRQQDYPADKIELWFVNDGSDDKSAQILASQSDVNLIDLPARSGKPTAINRALEAIGDVEVLVMTDARQPLSSDAISRLVATLGDERIGIAGGELVLRGADGHAAQIGLYWKYEKWIRTNESRYYSTLGTSGALYAIRKQDLHPLPEDTILDDFEIPVRTLRKGLRTILVPGACAYDRSETRINAEWARKVRTLTGNFQSFSRNGWLLLPWSNPAWWQLWSHKVFRLLVPYALIVLLLMSEVLDGWIYQALFWAQLVFYALALIGLATSASSAAFKPMRLAATFTALNAAAVAALVNYLTGSYSVKWRKSEQ